MRLKKWGRRFFTLVIVSWILISGTGAEAGSEKRLSSGETVYVPIYSNVFTGPKASTFDLAAMLSIRNTDPKHGIRVVRADYYDSKGSLLEGYIRQPLEIGPLASTYYYIKEYDKRGGPGAHFIVRWLAGKAVNMPIIEGVMLGLSSGQGVSFVCPGQIITEHTE